MTDIRIFLRTWQNTVIPLTDVGFVHKFVREIA